VSPEEKQAKQRAYNAAYYDANKDRLKVSIKAYQDANVTTVRAREKTYQERRKHHIKVKRTPSYSLDNERGLRQQFRTIKTGAEKRNLDFYLTFEDYKRLLAESNMRCALSGAPLSDLQNHPHKASIDRKNSNKGYTLDNVQVVSKTVNIMKQALSDLEFIRLCAAVATHNQQKKEISKFCLTPSFLDT
jgi:hypothetical protein